LKRPSFFRSACFLAILGLFASSCASYRQNIMFQVDQKDAVKAQVNAAEKNYVIQKNDQLAIEIYTKNGERLVDPDRFLDKDRPVQTTPVAAAEVRSYLVNQDGVVKFPMIDTISLEGLTLLQAEDRLQQTYTKFYAGMYIRLKYLNKRVVVLGAPGGQVIPLTNDNIRLTEVLALAKGVGNDAKAYNIRVLRGETVMVADLSTFAGYRENNIVIQPNDIVYVEPIRRPFIEGVRDYGPILSVLTSIATLIVVIIGL
jgi:polysaccharide export outer membrane protein